MKTTNSDTSYIVLSRSTLPITLLNVLLGCFLTVLGQLAYAADSEQLVADIEDHWSTTLHGQRTETISPFLVPLGAMKKIGGTWRLEAFQPLQGRVQRITWQVSGLPVAELFDELRKALDDVAVEQWRCSQRACGNGSEWASRVYEERLLYGRDEFMNYAAFETPDGRWITLFSAARTANRQYLHLDIVTPN